MSFEAEREKTSPRSLAVQALLVATTVVAGGIVLLGVFVSALFFLLLFAGAALALAPRNAPSAPGPLVGLIAAPALLFLALVLFMGFAFHPGFFLLLLVLVMFIGLARLLSGPPSRLDG